jgi:PhnB protein
MSEQKLTNNDDTMSTAYKAAGYNTLSPYLIVRGAAEAIEYYQAAFGAVERMRLEMPGGLIGHAEVQIDDAVVMLAEEMPGMGFLSPLELKGTPVCLSLYVPDVDAQFAKAIAAGGTVVQAVETKFYGDRAGQLRDPFGHLWTLMTHVEDVSVELMRQRMAKLYGGDVIG